jgi:hypothetical protein
VKHKAYPKYKDSGVTWLGDVPEHWEIKRLKTSAQYRVSNVDKVPAENELPVRLCNYTDVYNNELLQLQMELMETTATPAEIEKLAQLGPAPLREIRKRLSAPPSDRMIQEDLAHLRRLDLVESMGRGRGAVYRLRKTNE